MIIPNSKTKDYKQDATSFLKEQFEDPCGFIPKGYYYFTDTSILKNGNAHDLTGCYFYTDKDVPFLIMRSEHTQFKGFPMIDYWDVQGELQGNAAITLQYHNEHLQYALVEVSVLSNYPQVINGGFKGVVMDGETIFKSDHYKPNRIGCEAHWNTIRVNSKRLHTSFEAIRKGKGSLSSFSEININDNGSKHSLFFEDMKSNSDIRVNAQAMHSLTEDEKDLASIVLNDSGQNRLLVKSVDFKGKKHSDEHPVYSPWYVIDNNGERNQVISNWSMRWAEQYGKVKGINNLEYV